MLDPLDDLTSWRELGARYRKLRLEHKMVQEDVVRFGFSVRHYQQLEAGRPHSLRTLVRIAKMFEINSSELLQGLFKG